MYKLTRSHSKIFNARYELALLAIVHGLYVMPVYSQSLFTPTSVTRVSPIGAGSNPAVAGEIRETSVEIEPILYQSEIIRMRFVGFDPIVKQNSGLGSLATFMPALMWKPTKALGVFISEILPPVDAKIKIDDVPIVILKQQNMADIAVDAKVAYGIGAGLGYELNPRLALGANILSQSIGIKADITTTSGAELVKVGLQQNLFSLGAGLLFEAIPNKLSLGFASDIISTSSIKTSIDSPLLSGAGGAGANTGQSLDSTTNMPFSRMLGGVMVTFADFASFGFDLDWQRAPQNMQEFSLTDLAQKPKDIHDSVSVRAMGSFRPNHEQRIMVGGSYEPSMVGAGTPGTDGLSGFGLRETLMLYGGFQDLLPGYSFMVGTVYGEDLQKESAQVEPKTRHGRSKEPKRVTGLWSMTNIGAGLVYRQASLGIDESGELPAAYTQTKLGLRLFLIHYF